MRDTPSLPGDTDDEPDDSFVQGLELPARSAGEKRRPLMEITVPVEVLDDGASSAGLSAEPVTDTDASEAIETEPGEDDPDELYESHDAKEDTGG
jgi:hypothetical protein